MVSFWLFVGTFLELFCFASSTFCPSPFHWVTMPPLFPPVYLCSVDHSITASRGGGSSGPSMVLVTRNERVTSTNNRVETTIPNANGAAVLDSWQYKVLDYLFSIPIFNDALFGYYRKKMVKKAEGMGIKWTAFLEDLERNKDNLL